LSSPSKLADAFHQVRNEGLAGKTPLVFLDEFDSRVGEIDFGWFKYLLAPMQDGQFLDGDKPYYLPQSILVFLGSLNSGFRQLENRFRNQEFINAKGRDFVSRLRHYLEVKGPDSEGRKRIERGDSGEGRRLRRALLLRSALERKLPEILDELRENGKKFKRANIDRSIVEAFLAVSSYKHGVRSLEAIVDMSRASVTRRSFQKSSLPPMEQMDMHVDARNFLSIVRST
jgi:hypothetical protein